MRCTTSPARARTKKLVPDDVLGGTFTITNPGPFGTYMTMPIINQPQVAILSTDGIKKRPGGRRPAPTATTASRSTTPGSSCSRGTTARSTARTPPRSCEAMRDVLEQRDWEDELD